MTLPDRVSVRLLAALCVHLVILLCSIHAASATPVDLAGRFSEAPPFVYDSKADLAPSRIAAPLAAAPFGVSWGGVLGLNARYLGSDLRPASEFVAPNGTAGTIRNVNPTGSGMKCMNCVVATDATLSGRAASALPSGVQPISVLEDVFGGTFRPVSGQAEIAALMTDAGSGARGVVFGSRGSDVGHVFNAVNQGGTVRFLDGQTGGAASFSGFDGFEFMLIPG